MYLKLLCSFRHFSDLKFEILHALISIRATELKVKVTKFNGTAKLLRTCETGHRSSGLSRSSGSLLSRSSRSHLLYKILWSDHILH